MFWSKKPIVITDDARIDEVLTRGVENIFPNKDFLKAKMKRGERLTLYYGIDPTGPTLHVGHLIPLRKLKKLQEMGHKIIFMIGDFTAMIGDPTDKLATRKQLTHEQVIENCKEYKRQASKFINFFGPNSALFKFNSSWLEKMNFKEVLELSALVTVDQMLKRDMFQKRMEEGKPIYLHEFMYPLMQGYDSVALGVDGEIGGNDQTFNMLMGRDLMKTMKNKEKFVFVTKLLTDSTGKKMGKSEGNMVSLNQSPEDMFGKVMSWADGLIAPGFELVTDVPMHEIKQMQAEMERGSNPRDYKVRLAKDVVEIIHGEEAAERARLAFENTFKKGEVPADTLQILAEKGALIRDLIVHSKIVASNGEWKRLVEGRGVSEVGTDKVITDSLEKIEKDITLRIGKKRFAKIIIK
jgi:tyrosyl-tRNA synthetase